jgi:hypothetical protein
MTAVKRGGQLIIMDSCCRGNGVRGGSDVYYEALRLPAASDFFLHDLICVCDLGCGRW